MRVWASVSASCRESFGPRDWLGYFALNNDNAFLYESYNVCNYSALPELIIFMNF